MLCEDEGKKWQNSKFSPNISLREGSTTAPPSLSSTATRPQDTTAISLVKSDDGFEIVPGEPSWALGTLFSDNVEPLPQDLPIHLPISQLVKSIFNLGALNEDPVPSRSRSGLLCLGWARFLRIAFDCLGGKFHLTIHPTRRPKDQVQIVALTTNNEVHAHRESWTPQSLRMLQAVCVVPASISDFDPEMSRDVFLASGESHGALVLIAL